MATVYLDTSVLGRLLLQEPDEHVIRDALKSFDRRVSSRLLRVELRRVALRHDLLGEADVLLTGTPLIPLSDEVLALAGTLEPAAVGTLDAIHLATAVSLAAGVRIDAVMTYDKQLAAGARHHGLDVLSPA